MMTEAETTAQKKILLIQAPLGRNEKPVFPLGICHLVSTIRRDTDWQVDFFDPNFSPEPVEAIREEVLRSQARIIGFSLRNLDTTRWGDLCYYFLTLEQAIQETRKAAPETPIFIGGAGFSLYPEEIMSRVTELDLGVYLEGEETVVELLRAYPDFSGVAGIYLRSGDQVRFTGPRPHLAMDRIPSLRWDLCQVERYAGEPGAVGIQTKRGCILNCAYCTYPFLDGSEIRQQEAARVVDEMERLVRDHGVEDFQFVDTVFNIPREHALEICREMTRRELKVSWSAWFNERHLDRGLMEACLAAGCREFSCSPDGCDEATLKALNKAISREDIDRVVSLAEQVPGAKVSFNFFLNGPGQTLRGFLRLASFFVRTRRRLGDKLLCIVFSTIRIEPNTAIYQRALKEGLLTPETPLLPADKSGFDKLFYTNPKTRYLNVLMGLYMFLWRLKRDLRERRMLKERQRSAKCQ
jgi:radical SAM superfamily enzyme YgiQ (UPF0313 family)